MQWTDIGRYVLALEFLMGGQARLTPALTPGVHHFVMSKAEHFFRHLSFVPGATAQAKMQNSGAFMCLAAGLLALSRPLPKRQLRISSVAYAGSLSALLLVGESTIGGDVWLPSINVVLAAWLMYKEITQAP